MLDTLVNGDEITMFFVNAMAMTSKIKGIFQFISKDGKYIIYKQTKRKRKLFQRKIEETPLVFLGQDLPIGCDADGSVWRGNACLNLVCDLGLDFTRNWIEKNNLQENVSEHDKAHMMLMTTDEAADSEHELDYTHCLYPESGSSSSLVDGIRGKNSPPPPKAKNKEELDEYLSRFFGTDRFYSHPLKKHFVYTDGIKEYMDRAGAYWLSDTLVAVFQERLAQRDPDTYYLTLKVEERVNEMNMAYIQLFDYQGEVIKDLFISTDHIPGEFTSILGWDGVRFTWCLNSEN